MPDAVADVRSEGLSSRGRGSQPGALGKGRALEPKFKEAVLIAQRSTEVIGPIVWAEGLTQSREEE